MAWLCVQPKGYEIIWDTKPYRGTKNSSSFEVWVDGERESVLLPKGTIKRLIGDQLLKTHGKDHLTWDDEPVEFVEVAVE
jgi:hypothetical protein